MGSNERPSPAVQESVRTPVVYTNGFLIHVLYGREGDRNSTETNNKERNGTS